MKKKFLAMYALAGALVASPVFTSCVDDEVSPSVENIRNQKAEQLKALAALQNAQAEAAKITANAEAAYKAAVKAIDQAVNKGILHKNTAARKKSSMTLRLNKLA